MLVVGVEDQGGFALNQLEGLMQGIVDAARRGQISRELRELQEFRAGDSWGGSWA